MKRIWALSLGIVTIILIDQITKGAIQSHFSYGDSISVIDGFFNLTYVRNSGGAFGLFAETNDSIRKTLFLLLPLLASLWLIWLIWIHRNRELLPGVIYSLIFAGAVGNLIDRFAYGYVVDFLDFHWKGAHFPAFNVADSAISLGAFFLIVDSFIQYRRDRA